MKQKVVIQLSLNDQKCRKKAIKTAAGVYGVTEVVLQQEKNQIEVTGDGMDVICLTTLLRKSLKYAEVVSVSPVEEKKEENEDDPSKLVCPYVGSMPVYYEPPYQYHRYQDPSCSIM